MLTKNTKRNGKLTVKEVTTETAKSIITKNHYSKKWGASFGKLNLGIFKDGKLDESGCLGVAVFGDLMNPTSVAKISDVLKQENILELNRLWLNDCIEKNAETVFLSLAFKYIKKYRPEVKVIQSFADGRLGVGTVYKAANFKYYGANKTIFFEHLDGSVTHRVSFVNTRKLPAMLSLNLLYCLGEFKKFAVNSYRYLYFLDRNLIPKIKLKEMPYPVYQKGVEYDKEYKLGLNALARVALSFEKIGLLPHKKVVVDYIKNTFDKEDITSEELEELSQSKLFEEIWSDHSAADNIRKRYYNRLNLHPNENREVLLWEYIGK